MQNMMHFQKMFEKNLSKKNLSKKNLSKNNLSKNFQKMVIAQQLVNTERP